jgi:hypothetical protein
VNIATDISTAATNLLHNKQHYLGAEIMYVPMAGFPGHFSYTNRTNGIEPLDSSFSAARNQESTSAVEVIRKQVQPVSLHTR